MKKYALFAITAIFIGGCTTLSTPLSQTQHALFVQACGAYGLAFQTALQLRIAGKLTNDQIDNITKIDATVIPICAGAMPTNAQDVINQVLVATATLTLNSKQ